MSGNDVPALMPTGPVTRTTAGLVVPLAAARFVIRGQFFDPRRGQDVPLPDHQFGLLNLKPGSLAPIFGGPSNKDGISWIEFEDDLRFDGVDPFAEWELAWRPLFRNTAGRLRPALDVQRSGEVFLDLDKQEWVLPREVGRLDARRLIRLPVWSSSIKVLVGGFLEGVPKTRFAETGVFSMARGESVAHGTLVKPWVVQVDHGLFRNFVRFHYYDVANKKRAAVPSHVVVEALGRPRLSPGHEPPSTDQKSVLQRRVAAGTPIDDSGNVYLLHERTEQDSGDVHYYFATVERGQDGQGVLDADAAPAHRVQVKAGAAVPDNALLANGGVRRPASHYYLPREWHSHGMLAFIGAPDGQPVERREFEALRTRGVERASPLCFHLDDMVLADENEFALQLNGKSRVALFDHWLHIRDPDPARPHVWRTLPQKNYFPAETAVVQEGQGIERRTRLVYHDGRFHDLHERRMTIKSESLLGHTDCVGARVALLDDSTGRRLADYMHGIPNQTVVFGSAEYHLIDASFMDHEFPATTSGAVNMKLMHLLVHIPLRLDGSRVSGAELDRMLPALTHAAERWDQKHPGHPNAPPPDRVPCTMGLVPLTGAAAGDKVVRVRHYFGEGPSRADAVVVHVRPAGGRASAGHYTPEITVFDGDIDESRTQFQAHLDDERRQNPAFARFTLAHELGHKLGWPDEYDELMTGLASFSALRGRFLGLQQAIEGVIARPFATDEPSIMNSNSHPRLRHYWIYANRLREEAKFREWLDGKDYVAIDTQTVPGTLMSSELPFVGPSVLPDEANHAWYRPVAGPRPLHATNRADIAVYRLPQDQGTVRKMFLGPGGTRDTALPPNQRYDGIALVYTRILFNFADSLGETKRLECLEAIVFSARLMDVRFAYRKPKTGHLDYVERIRYMLQVRSARSNRPPTAEPCLQRIALSVSPLIESVQELAQNGERRPRDPHLTIDVVEQRESPHPLLDSRHTGNLVLTPSEVVAFPVAILCYALAAKPVDANGRLKVRFSASDFARVATSVSQLLHDPPGVQRAVESAP
ncbi:MAG TPA: hypothetical protein VFQ61_09560 [Polyangiaceae bacterium]|nr:hypothetical protein [Polyangiaceae bacterium]